MWVVAKAQAQNSHPLEVAVEEAIRIQARRRSVNCRRLPISLQRYRRGLPSILPRDEAKAFYSEAKSRGLLARLLDQERPQLITQSVSASLPGQQLKIRSLIHD